MESALAALLLTACASEQPPDPVITSFSSNHVTIAAPDWPGHMAYEYCRTQGKGELLVSREGWRYHFACLAREYLAGEDEGDDAGLGDTDDPAHTLDAVPGGPPPYLNEAITRNKAVLSGGQA